MIIRLSVVFLVCIVFANAELYPGPLLYHQSMVNEPMVSDNSTTCPVVPTIILRGAPSFTHSVFEELVLNAAETYIDSADVLDPCPGCTFSWVVCHYLDRSNECIPDDDLPPPFAAVASSHDRILHLPLAIANLSCTNASGVPNGINSTCVANPFGDFDVMALSGELYKFQVTVTDRDGCQDRKDVNVYFEIVEIPPSEESSNEYYCYIHALIDGPRNYSHSVLDPLFLNATAFYTEDSSATSNVPDTSTVAMDTSTSSFSSYSYTEEMKHWKPCPDCTYHWSICHLTDLGCSENVPALLSSISLMNTSEITLDLVSFRGCWSEPNPDPACQALMGQTYRISVKAKNDVCVKSKVFIVVTFVLPPPGCPLKARIHAPCYENVKPCQHSVWESLQLDGSDSYYLLENQCPGCTYEWKVEVVVDKVAKPVTDINFLMRALESPTNTVFIPAIDQNGEATCSDESKIPEERCFNDPPAASAPTPLPPLPYATPYDSFTPAPSPMYSPPYYPPK